MSGGDRLLEEALENIKGGASNGRWRSFGHSGIVEIIEGKTGLGEFYSSNGQSQQRQQGQEEALSTAGAGQSLVAGGQFREELWHSRISGEERRRVVEGEGVFITGGKRRDSPYGIDKKDVCANCSKDAAGYIATDSARGRGRGCRRGENRVTKRASNMVPAKIRAGGRRSCTNLIDHTWMSRGTSSGNRVENDLHSKVVRGGSKDRHSKVRTAKGLRDRRVRLSAPTAIQFFDVQDRLGLEQPSQAVDWLIRMACSAIEELPASVPSETKQEQQQELVHPTSTLKEEEVWTEGGTGGGCGGRAELRAKARERARERAKEKSCAQSVGSPTSSCHVAESGLFDTSGGGRSVHEPAPFAIPLAQPGRAFSAPGSTMHSKSSTSRSLFDHSGCHDNAFVNLLNVAPAPPPAAAAAAAMLGPAAQLSNSAAVLGSGCGPSSLFFSPRGTLQSIYNPVPALPPCSVGSARLATLPPSGVTYDVTVDAQYTSRLICPYFNQQALQQDKITLNTMSDNVIVTANMDMADPMHVIANMTSTPGVVPITRTAVDGGMHLHASGADDDETKARHVQNISVVTMANTQKMTASSCSGSGTSRNRNDTEPLSVLPITMATRYQRHPWRTNDEDSA